jgi:hypothetical protein
MRGALLVVLLLAQTAAAQSLPRKPADEVLEKAGEIGTQPAPVATTCDPAEATELRAHLEQQARHARNWNLIWGAIFATSAAGSAAVGYINPAPELQVGFYTSAGKASIGALGRFILPLRIPVPPPNPDVCADVAALHKAIALAAKREKGNFYLNHIAGILVNGAGALIIWKYADGGQALLSVATGYPVGLLSNYTAPRGSWHLYRERQTTWTTTVVRHEHGWTLGIAGSF